MLLAHPQADRPMQMKLDFDRRIPVQDTMIVLPALEPATLFCDQRIALFDERMLETKRVR